MEWTFGAKFLEMLQENVFVFFLLGLELLLTLKDSLKYSDLFSNLEST